MLPAPNSGTRMDTSKLSGKIINASAFATNPCTEYIPSIPNRKKPSQKNQVDSYGLEAPARLPGNLRFFWFGTFPRFFWFGALDSYGVELPATRYPSDFITAKRPIFHKP